MKSSKDLIFAEFCEKYGFINGIEDYENMHGSTLRVRAKERAQFLKPFPFYKTNWISKRKIERNQREEKVLKV